ncbi:MAG: glycosyltransferase family 4 protein [Pirellulales bacterium]|nr:glycosyltransferase family 4 protein [Pirellulales bacterium]
MADSPGKQKRRPDGSPGERWVIVTQYYPPEPGAPQIRLPMLARELKRAGIDVRVLTGMPNYPEGVIHEGYRGKFFLRETIDGIPVSRVWLYPAVGRKPIRRIINYLTFSFFATFYLLFFMRNVDVLFVESQPISLGMAGLLMKWFRRVPYIYNIPDLQTDVAKQLSFVGWRLLLSVAVWFENLFMRQSWTVSTVTHRFIDYYVERGIPRAQISFLPNGADTDVLRPLHYDRAYAEKMGVAGRTTFTYAGTHAHYHGLEVLVETARVLRDRPDIVLLLVGKGPVRPVLQQQAAEYGLTNIVFGDSPFAEMVHLMSITYASLVVMKDVPVAEKMRLSKTFPPLACGVPVVYSGRGESADMVAEHGCGVQVPPGSPELLAEAILQLADDPARRDEMGRRGVELVDRELSWASIIRNWLAQLKGTPLPAPAQADRATVGTATPSESNSREGNS